MKIRKMMSAKISALSGKVCKPEEKIAFTSDAAMKMQELSLNVIVQGDKYFMTLPCRVDSHMSCQKFEVHCIVKRKQLLLRFILD